MLCVISLEHEKKDGREHEFGLLRQQFIYRLPICRRTPISPASSSVKRMPACSRTFCIEDVLRYTVASCLWNKPVSTTSWTARSFFPSNTALSATGFLGLRATHV